MAKNKKQNEERDIKETNVSMLVQEIEKSEQALKNAIETNHWDRLEKEVKGDWSDLKGLIANPEISALNIPYAYIKTELPALYAQDPHIEITAEDNTPPAVAFIKERLVSDVWKRKKLKRQFKKVIKDAKTVKRGWLKVGYKATVGQAEVEDGIVEGITSEEYFVYRIPWKNIIWDREAIDPPYDCRWMAHKFYIPISVLKQNKEFKHTKDIQGVTLVQGQKKEDRSNSMDIPESLIEYAELYELWDKDTKKKYIISKQVKDFPLHEVDWPYTNMVGFPFVCIDFGQESDDPFGPSDVQMFENEVLEETKLYAALLDHVKKGNRQIGVDKNKITPESEAAYEEGQTMALLKFDGSPHDAMAAVPYPPAPFDIYPLMDRLANIRDGISGQTPDERGSQAKATTRTIGELRLRRAGTAGRRSDQVDIVEDAAEEVTEKLIALFEQYLTLPYFVAVTGLSPEQMAAVKSVGGEAGPTGFKVTNKQLKGAVTIKIKSGSTVPLDRNAKLELYERFLQLGMSAGAIPGGPLVGGIAKLIADELDIPEIKQFLAEEVELQNKIKEEQQQALDEERQLKAASESTKMQLDAEKISVDKLDQILKFIEKMQVDLGTNTRKGNANER